MKSSGLAYVGLLSLIAISGTTLPSFAQETAEKPGVIESGVRVSGQVVQKTGAGLGDAALSPLEDLNLRRDKIPLEFDAFQTPYDDVTPFNCDTIAIEVRTLDTLLEVDIDVQLEMMRRASEEQEGKSSKNGKVAEQASGLALGTIASEARGLIPFRGLVRKATGASAYEQKLNAAYEKAYLRRSYLKGLGKGIGCRFPASPLPIQYFPEEKQESSITYRGSSPNK